jgi:hypothetical protein
LLTEYLQQSGKNKVRKLARKKTKTSHLSLIQIRQLHRRTLRQNKRLAILILVVVFVSTAVAASIATTSTTFSVASMSATVCAIAATVVVVVAVVVSSLRLYLIRIVSEIARSALATLPRLIKLKTTG